MPDHTAAIYVQQGPLIVENKSSSHRMQRKYTMRWGSRTVQDWPSCHSVRLAACHLCKYSIALEMSQSAVTGTWDLQITESVFQQGMPSALVTCSTKFHKVTSHKLIQRLLGAKSNCKKLPTFLVVTKTDKHTLSWFTD
jgi:hypothetical protein